MLQGILQPMGPDGPQWRDIRVVYEDPGDEVIECPLVAPHGYEDRVCFVCGGEGQGRRGDIEARLRQLKPPFEGGE